MQTVQQLEELAEKNRCAGDRDNFLKIQNQIEAKKQEEVLSRHKQYLKNTKKDFPVGFYIPELNAKVTEIKDGCGTQRGWIDIYLSGSDKHFTPQELRRKIRLAKEEKTAREYFDKLKFSDTKTLLYIGEKNYDTLEYLIKVMGLDLPTIEEIDDFNVDWLSQVMTEARKQAIEDGFTDDDAEDKALEAESEEMSRIYEEHLSAALKTLNYLLNFHDIELTLNKKGYSLIAKYWKASADKVAETISGYGMFYYANGKELKDIGPYKTYCEAIIQHLHWLKYYPEVYGYTNYRRIYER